MMNHISGFPFLNPNILASTNSTSSSTSSNEGPPEVRRKRKWKDLFERLMKEVSDKQEELHMKLLDQIEKWEREQMARNEAWRMEDMAKMNREHDVVHLHFLNLEMGFEHLMGKAMVPSFSVRVWWQSNPEFGF